jgi:hypothetical protein
MANWRAVTAETPLDPAALFGDTGDIATEMPVARRRPRDEGKPKSVVRNRLEVNVRRWRYAAAGT